MKPFLYTFHYDFFSFGASMWVIWNVGRPSWPFPHSTQGRSLLPSNKGHKVVSGGDRLLTVSKARCEWLLVLTSLIFHFLVALEFLIIKEKKSKLQKHFKSDLLNEKACLLDGKGVIQIDVFTVRPRFCCTFTGLEFDFIIFENLKENSIHLP